MSHSTDASGPRSLFTPTAPAPARYLTRDECQTLAARILAFSKAESAQLTIAAGLRGSTRFVAGQISTSGDTFDHVVSVTSTFGKRSATVTTNKLDDASLHAVVDRAETLARLAPEDPEMMPNLGPQQYQESGGWSERTAHVDAAARAAAVRAVTASATGGASTTGYLETRMVSFAVANTTGLFAYRRETSATLTTSARSADGTGSGWAGASHHDFTQLDPAAVGARAVNKARRSANPVAIEPGRYTVVLEPAAVGNLIPLLSFMFVARSADEGRSFSSKPGGGNNSGLKVVDERVTLVTDPADPDAPSPAFGADGLPVGRRVWIENGVLETLMYDRFWARKQGVAPNFGGGTGVLFGGFGGAIGGFKMSGGTATTEELIASTQRGILCTRLWYIRPIDQRTMLFTGLTRDGTFLIENGKITHPIKNLRWNESLIVMLNNIEALGRTERVVTAEDGGPGQAIVVPSMKVRDFTFTSLSDAV